jgi:hypothetical protein
MPCFVMLSTLRVRPGTSSETLEAFDVYFSSTISSLGTVSQFCPTRESTLRLFRQGSLSQFCVLHSIRVTIWPTKSCSGSSSNNIQGDDDV